MISFSNFCCSMLSRVSWCGGNSTLKEIKEIVRSVWCIKESKKVPKQIQNINPDGQKFHLQIRVVFQKAHPNLLKNFARIKSGWPVLPGRVALAFQNTWGLIHQRCCQSNMARRWIPRMEDVDMKTWPRFRPPPFVSQSFGWAPNSEYRRMAAFMTASFGLDTCLFSKVRLTLLGLGESERFL